MTNSFEVSAFGASEDATSGIVAHVAEPATDRTIAAVDALSQLLAMNAAIDAVRSEAQDRFAVSANRVTEIAQPEAVTMMAVDRVSDPASAATATALKTSVIAFTTQHSRR
jgi:hypothetical protein